MSFDPSVHYYWASRLSEISEKQIEYLMYSSEILLKTVPSKRQERSGNE